MRYFAGYLLEGEAAAFYNTLAADLAARFGIRNLAEYIPPHFTLKAPFETRDIAPFKEQLSALAAEETPVTFLLEGFGRFREKGVIFFYIGGEKLWECLPRIVECIAPFGDNRKELNSEVLKTHISVARRVEEPLRDEIWRYVKNLPKPRFELRFDNIALFRFEEGKWMVENVYRFGS